MQIRFLQWNILYKEKIENVVKTIKELNPDIVCLQELGINCKYNPSIPETANYVREHLEYYHFFKEAQRWDNDEEFDAIGNGIFSRFPIIKTYHKHVQDPVKDFTDYSHEGRIYIEADLNLGHKMVTVGTTHLSYVHKLGMTEEKKLEVGRLTQIIKQKKHDYIFSGDMNSIPDSYTIIELSNYLNSCGPTFEKNTWTTKPFDYHGFKEDQLQWRLDYIFATNDMKCISSEIIKTSYSDHLPVLATFEI